MRPALQYFTTEIDALPQLVRMEALRGIIDKVGNKSKDNDEHSRSGPDTSPVYRSSDASGEPDVGTKSYSRDKGVSRDDWDDRRQKDPNTSSYYSSRADEGRGYSTGSSGGAASGLGSERSLSGDSGRDNDPNYSTMSAESSTSITRASSDNYPSSGRRHNSKEHSRRSDNDDNEEYSSYSSGATRGYDETGDMGGGHNTRGMYGHSSRSSEEGMSGGKQTYRSYSNSNSD